MKCSKSMDRFLNDRDLRHERVKFDTACYVFLEAGAMYLLTTLCVILIHTFISFA